jgi:hypothetical protein
MGGKIYESFIEVEQSTSAGKFSNEAELQQAFIEALKVELKRLCESMNKGKFYEYGLVPFINRTITATRPDIRLGNLIVEIEPPNSDLSNGRKQLRNYICELSKSLGGNVEIHGIVTNGVEAEYWYFREGSCDDIIKKAYNKMSTIMSYVLHVFCSNKITITDPEQLTAIFGVLNHE